MARSKRWVVDAASPRELKDVLAAMGAGPEAVAQGRVFIGRKRAQELSRRLQPGEVVEVFAAAAPGALLRAERLDARDGVVAWLKPAGMPTVPDHRGSEGTLQAAVAAAEGLGDVQRVHPSSRLDREVSGVVLFALDERARKRLQAAREQGQYLRHYLAIAQRAPVVLRGEVNEPIGRAPEPRMRQIGGASAAASCTRYAVASHGAGRCLLAVEPVTGRTHQIRVHMAHLGAPLLGDELYGGGRSLVAASGAVRDVRRVALHASWVQVQDGAGERWVVRAPMPQDFGELWTLLGGTPGELQDADRPL
jgi:RluA family pseudouridine synthase